VIQATVDATCVLTLEEQAVGMRARRVHYKKSGAKHIQYTSPGYGGWCGSRNRVRGRVQLEPLERKADKSASKVEGGMPLSINLDFSSQIVCCAAGAVDEIDEID